MSDLNTKCSASFWFGKHMAGENTWFHVAVIVAMIIVPIGTPLFGMYILQKNKANVRAEKSIMRATYSTFVGDYKVLLPSSPPTPTRSKSTPTRPRPLAARPPSGQR